MTEINHGAVGPALGYYYQAIYALIQLFNSVNNDAFVSIESFDDVFHNDGDKKELIQLKHTMVEGTKISIKSEQLWKTIKVWCDFIRTNDPRDGIFTLSTVATIDKTNPLTSLMNKNSDRDLLILKLTDEANRVIRERELTKKENIRRLANGKHEKILPYESRYKGCKAFLELDNKTRTIFISRIQLVTDSFKIDSAKDEVISQIKKTIQQENLEAVAEDIIAWWDREAVRSLTRERKECIYFSELQEFISKRNAELYNDGFSNDLDELDIPPFTNPNPIQQKQLEIIAASNSQKRRSYDTEIRARIQRNIWMKRNISAISKLSKYDEELVREWSYIFEENKEESRKLNEVQKQEKGRELLNWSHNEAPNQIRPISKNYSNPDLIRGSYQMLSTKKDVGWHCEYETLINQIKNEDE